MSYYQDVYLKSKEWKTLKSLKESKSPKRCSICLSDGLIDLHHLFYRENLNDAQTSDLRWLCRRCHEKAHDLINRGIIVFKKDWSHHAMFAVTKSKVKQSLGMVRIHIDENCSMAKKIDDSRTEKGGFTKASLEKLGVPWPPPKGWRKKLIRDSLAEKILSH